MKSPFSLVRQTLPLLLVLFCASFVARAQDDYPSIKTWESYDFAGKTMAPAEVVSPETDDLKLLRGTVFGNHGRVFKDTDIRRSLSSRPWLRVGSSFQNFSLNDNERHNLDV